LRGEVWDRALIYAKQAGTRAFSRSAHREAVGWFEHALTVIDHLHEDGATLAEAIDIRLSLRYSLVPVGDFDRIIRYLREAEALAQRLGDQGRLSMIAAFLTNYYQVIGDLDAAMGSGERAVRLAEVQQDEDTACIARAYLGQALQSFGDHARAIGLARQNLASLGGERIHERFGMALLPSVYSRTLLVWSLAELGQFEEGLTLAEEGVKIAESVNHPYSRVYAQLGLGRLLLRQGELSRAIAVFEGARALCESAEIPVLSALVLLPLGVAYAQSGRSEEALEILTEARRHASAIGLRALEPLSLTAVGEAYLQAGRKADALATARESVNVTLAIRARGSHAWALRLLGEAAARQDPPAIEEAERAYRDALLLGSELGMAPLLARCHLGLGLLYLGARQADAARELTCAQTMLRRLNMRLWLRIVDDVLTGDLGRSNRPGSE
jgi:tetratricopeptide (TPR) repeat protein